MQMYKKLLFSAIFLFGSLFSNGSDRVLDTPTAINPDKGSYRVEFTFYSGNGIYTRATLGINPFLSMGIMEYIDGFIGNDRIQFHVPGVQAKLSFLDNPLEGYNFAIGYDALNTGSFSQHEEKLYAAYGVLTKGWFLVAPSPHLFNLGFKWPIFKKSNYPIPFTSLLFNLGPILSYGIELDSFGFSENDPYSFLNSHIIKLSIGESVNVSLSIQIAAINSGNQIRETKGNIGRNITLGYLNYF